jgi:hypothetical protein
MLQHLLLLLLTVLQFRADRGVAPLYADIVASRDTTMKAALQRRQVCFCFYQIGRGGGGCLAALWGRFTPGYWLC